MSAAFSGNRTSTIGPVLSVAASLAPHKRPYDYTSSVRSSLNVRRILRELAHRAAVLALTTTTLPQTTDDVHTAAGKIARRLIP